MNHKILVIDDERDIFEMYGSILRGYELAWARTEAEASTRLDEEDWEVVLLDELLTGSGGDAAAARLLLEIAQRAPLACTIVVTGYSTVDRIQQALANGAWEYLDKDYDRLKLLLPLRVRHALDAARARRLARMSGEDREGELVRTWAEVAVGSPQQRGRTLEHVLRLLLGSIQGFEEPRVNVRGESEEFDLVVQNGSPDPVLVREGAVVLVECKNWSRATTKNELVVFRQKLRDRFKRATLGLLVGLGGFEAGVATHVARGAEDRALVVLVDREALDEWIRSADRSRWLRERLVAATVGG